MGDTNLGAGFYDQAYFDGGKGYHSYGDAEHFNDTAEHIINWFNPRTVLEIGCAKGYLVKALRERGVKAYGLDISEYAVANAPEEVADYLFVYDVTSGQPLEFPRYDLIVSFDTFEHLPEADLDKVWTFLNKHGNDAYIRVGTLNTPDWQHDPSHITMHRLEWWMNRYPRAIWEDSK